MSTDRTQLLNDPIQTLRLALDGRQANIWTSFPGIVQSVDFSEMTCSVQPAIQGTVENQDGSFTSVNLPILIHVPIVFPSAGGFLLTLPLKANDEVLVCIGSRCIDAWWQSGGVQRAIEARMHDLSDGFAIPGPRSVPKVVAGISTTGAQLRNDAGTSYVEISGDGKIKLVGSEIDVTGNLKVSGTVTGNTASVPVSLTTHTHTGVTTGSGSTGGPV